MEKKEKRTGEASNLEGTGADENPRGGLMGLDGLQTKKKSEGGQLWSNKTVPR